MMMAELASGWPEQRIIEARSADQARHADPAAWARVKAAYAETLCGYVRTWAASAGAI
jgi:hypothetical protein